jgi:DNA invertase Pin-like site-specific DNA recombinase
MKTVALYLRVSSVDQHPETQLYDLRAMAQQRGFQIVAEYTDRISGTKARRPGLDVLLRDARRGRFQVLMVWASDRIARSVRHFLECSTNSIISTSSRQLPREPRYRRPARAARRDHHRGHRRT